MERFSLWNARSASGTPQALERAKRNLNNLELSGTIWNYLERALAPSPLL